MWLHTAEAISQTLILRLLLSLSFPSSIDFLLIRLLEPGHFIIDRLPLAGQMSWPALFSAIDVVLHWHAAFSRFAEIAAISAIFIYKPRGQAQLPFTLRYAMLRLPVSFISFITLANRLPISPLTVSHSHIEDYYWIVFFASLSLHWFFKADTVSSLHDRH